MGTATVTQRSDLPWRAEGVGGGGIVCPLPIWPGAPHISEIKMEPLPEELKNVSSIPFDRKSLPLEYSCRSFMKNMRPLFTFNTPSLVLKEQIIRPFASEE